MYKYHEAHTSLNGETDSPWIETPTGESLYMDEVADHCNELLAYKIANDKLELALSLALNIIFADEPPDSRAVSDEFVAMAAVLAGCDNQEAIDIIRKGLLIPRENNDS